MSVSNIVNVDTITEATRSALGLMVSFEERRVGSVDVAYEKVAKTVGASTSWVKKFVRGDDMVAEPRMTLFLNIRAAYEDVCDRVEQEHQNEVAKLALLRGRINATTDGFVELVDRSHKKVDRRARAAQPHSSMVMA
jgi:hypothetical protein